MINFNKNKLINQVLEKYYETFSYTLDTVDFVPKEYNEKINKYIFKNMKKHFKKIDREDRKFQREFKKLNKSKSRAKKKLKGEKRNGILHSKTQKDG